LALIATENTENTEEEKQIGRGANGDGYH